MHRPADPAPRCACDRRASGPGLVAMTTVRNSWAALPVRVGAVRRSETYVDKGTLPDQAPRAPDPRSGVTSGAARDAGRLGWARPTRSRPRAGSDRMQPRITSGLDGAQSEPS